VPGVGAVEGWFRFLHRLGLLEVWTLSAIPSSSAAAFEEAMTGAVRAGRTPPFVNGYYDVRIQGVKNGLTVASGGAGKPPRPLA
jgi:hypothetical protein